MRFYKPLLVGLTALTMASAGCKLGCGVEVRSTPSGDENVAEQIVEEKSEEQPSMAQLPIEDRTKNALSYVKEKLLERELSKHEYHHLVFDGFSRVGILDGNYGDLDNQLALGHLVYATNGKLGVIHLNGLNDDYFVLKKTPVSYSVYDDAADYAVLKINAGINLEAEKNKVDEQAFCEVLTKTVDSAAQNLSSTRKNDLVRLLVNDVGSEYGASPSYPCVANADKVRGLVKLIKEVEL